MKATKSFSLCLSIVCVGMIISAGVLSFPTAAMTQQPPVLEDVDDDDPDVIEEEGCDPDDHPCPFGDCTGGCQECARECRNYCRFFSTFICCAHDNCAPDYDADCVQGCSDSTGYGDALGIYNDCVQEKCATIDQYAHDAIEAVELHLNTPN